MKRNTLKLGAVTFALSALVFVGCADTMEKSNMMDGSKKMEKSKMMDDSKMMNDSTMMKKSKMMNDSKKMHGMDKMAKMEPAFGGAKDVAYSQKLWKQLEATNLNTAPATLYVGGPPHGAVREVLEGKIDGNRVIVKRNYGGEGVSIESVKQDREKFLKAVTVMIKKDGYDPKNNDWYWAKYKADGSLHQTPKGDKIAGKFVGCIGCHQSASGGDLVFVHNKEANADITLVDTMKKMK